MTENLISPVLVIGKIHSSDGSDSKLIVECDIVVLTVCVYDPVLGIYIFPLPLIQEKNSSGTV